MSPDDEGGRRQRRNQRQELSHGQLLDAAEQVFGQRGFHEATLKEIAERAEFSVGSIYSFFEGKDDLYRQVVVRRSAEFMIGMRAVLHGDAPATDKLHRLVDFQIGFFRSHHPFGRLLLRFGTTALLSEANELDTVIFRNFTESMQLQSDLFACGQGSGEFCPGDAGVLAHLFSGLISAYQAVDPSIMTDDPQATGPMSLEELHQVIGHAFAP